MIEVPSVEHENVEDGDGAHVVHGRLLLGVRERGSTEDSEREQIQRSANDNEK